MNSLGYLAGEKTTKVVFQKASGNCTRQKQAGREGAPPNAVMKPTGIKDPGNGAAAEDRRICSTCRGRGHNTHRRWGNG